MTIFGIVLTAAQAFWFVLLGSLVILATLAGGVILLGKFIFDQVEGVRRAQSAWDKKTREIDEGSRINKKRPPRRDYKDEKRGELISTTQLQKGDIVYLRSGQWRIVEKLVTFLGVIITLENLSTRQLSKNRIRPQEVEQRVWALRPRDWTGG